ncbi:MAG: hypothetical protein HY518_00500 [Candidatus Aenigmarchaeota archaeon]|nr:hypothetical protein [Candidatus Aenigmarchaeota archaeon]
MVDFEAKYNEARRIILEWTDKQGHDRCWYYPELYKELAKVLDVTPSADPSLPPLGEFRRGCERYQQEEYGPNGKTRR